MLRLFRSFSTTPRLDVKHVRKLRGPKSVDVFSVSDLIALLSQDFTYANSMMHVLNLKTHMLGEGKCGEELLPSDYGLPSDFSNVDLLQKLNSERLSFQIILSLRYPSIWEFAQSLVKARQNTLLQPRNKPSIYFDQIETLLNISVEHRHLGANELFPTSGHLAVQEIRLLAENMYGREVMIAPYTEKEIDHVEKVKAMLMEKNKDVFEAFKAFNPREYLARPMEAKQASIAADVEFEQTRRLSL